MLGNENYKFIFDSVPSIIFIWHPQHRLQYVSPFTEKAIGYSPAELIGGQAILQDIMHHSQFGRILQNLNKIIAAEPGESFSEYVCCRHKNGQAIWLNMSMTKQENAAGEAVLVGSGQVVSNPNDLHRAEMRVRLLHNVSLSLNKTINLADFGNLVMYQLTCEEGITAAALYLKQAESEALTLINLQWTGLTAKSPAGYPLSTEGQQNKPTLSNHTVEPQAIHIDSTEPQRTVHPVFTEVQKRHPELAPITVGLISPLLIKDNVIGEIAIGRAEGPPFNPAEEILMTIIAQMIAGSVDYIQRLQKELHEHQLSDKLRQVLAVLVSSLNLETTLTAILEKLDDLLDFDSASVYLLEANNKLRLVSARRLPNPEKLKQLINTMSSFPLDKRVLSKKKPLAINDVRQNPDWQIIPSTEHIRSWLGVPLIYQNTPIGLVTINRNTVNPFTQEQIHLSQTFAGYAAIAIGNAQLFSQTQEQQKLLRKLSNRIVEAQEEERRRISQELHDELGQTLTALKVTLSMLTQEVPESLPGLKASLSEQVALTSRFLNDVRRLAIELRPSILDDLGLEPALQSLIKQTQKGLNIAFTFTITPKFPRLASSIETALYRVVQEALTNISRHAQATEVRLEVAYTPKAVFCHIEDNGNGFDLSKLQRRPETKGLGLIGMQERIEALNGQLHFTSTPQQGTHIKIKIPLKALKPA